MTRHEIPRSARGGSGGPTRGPRGVLGEATRAYHERTGLREGGRRERRRLIPRGAPPGPGGRALPVDPQPRQGPGGQGHPAIVPPVALSDTDPPARGIEGRDRPRRPFPSAPPTRRDPLQTQAGLRAWSQGWPRAPCRRTQHDGQGLAGPGPGALADRPRALPRALVAAPAPIAMQAERALGDLLLLAQGEDVVPELRCATGLRRPSVVWRPVFDGVEIAWRGPGGQAPALEVCQPPASERRQRSPPVRGNHQGSQWSTRIRTRENHSACGKNEKQAPRRAG
jgi:hypothetical protein